MGEEADDWTRRVLELFQQGVQLPSPDLIEYARRMYARGIGRYTAALTKIGFVGAARGLDAGSGPGQWSVALASLNGDVVGVEKRSEFVELSRRVIDRLGLSDRVSFQVGRIEDADFTHGSFDVAVCHGVLMYTDHELALTNLSHALTAGGQLYCGYTATGLRLRKACACAAAGEWEKTRSMLLITLSAELYRLGMHHVVGGRVRSLERDELERLASVLGLDPVGRPQIQDESGLWLDRPLTYDFLARRVSTPLEREDEMASIDPDPEWLRSIGALARAGAPRMALRLLDRCATGAEASTARVVALLKLGRLADAEDLLARVPSEEATRLRGCMWLQRHAFDRATEELARIAHPDADDEFLIACAHMGQGDLDEAQAMFASQLERIADDVRALCGAVACALDAGREAAALGFLIEFLTSGLAATRSSREGSANSDESRALEALIAAGSKLTAQS